MPKFKGKEYTYDEAGLTALAKAKALDKKKKKKKKKRVKKKKKRG